MILPEPPQARRIPKVDVIHGEERTDDYFWLREKENPEVIRYLEAENAYTAGIMKPAEALQETLYQEMLGRIKETDQSVPYRQGDFFYYSRTTQGLQYPAYCRKKGALDAPEEVVLDLNALAAGQKFLALGVFAVSDNGRLLAYSLDNTGFRQYTLQVKDLDSGQLLMERMEKTGSLAWATDQQSFFYTVEDHAKRHYRLYRHRLGEKVTGDVLIYQEDDERFRLTVRRSRSRAFLFLTSSSHTATEVRFLPAGQSEGDWKVVEPRRPGHEYEVDHHGERFYIRTNDAGRNFRLVSAPVTAPGKENWTEVVPHRAEVMLEGMEFFSRHYVLLEREDGLPRLRVTDFGSGARRDIAFPEPAYSASPEINREFDTTAFRYSYQSMVTPASVFDYDMETGVSRLLKQTEVLGGYDRAQYQAERLWAAAADGARIPISIVYRRGLKRDGSAPAALYGYGSYGAVIPVAFQSNRLSLLDRGFVCAIAHIRGGGEMGKAWHDQGKMMNKRNTFTDFIAAAEFLFEERYTSRERLAILGGSAGGLLLGAVINLRPDLCGAAIALVPFMDVINSMLDESLPLTVGEFEEWGNPRKKEEYEYMKSYCPYSNLESKAYPAMLVKASLHDSQVMYWEPAKYIAKLRALNDGAKTLLLKTNLAAGHGGASGRYDHLREAAFDYAFLLARSSAP